MPPKKVAEMKATTDRKTTKTKKITLKKPNGVTKKTTASTKTVTPAPKKVAVKAAGSTKTEINIKKSQSKPAAAPKSKTPRKSAGDMPFDPDRDVIALVRSWGCTKWESERAAELYHLFGAQAMEASGSDWTVLLNACWKIAWDESSKSFGTSTFLKRKSCGDGAAESKFGCVDAKHSHDSAKWSRLVGSTQGMIARLMHSRMAEEGKKNFARPSTKNSLTYPDGLQDCKDSQSLIAELSTKTPTKASRIVKNTAIKEKASVKMTPSKTSGMTKKTPSKTTSITKIPVRKTRSTTPA